MTTEEQDFDQSYWRALGAHVDGRDLAEAFYERFRASSDEVRAKFEATDFEKQKRLLLISLGFMCSFSVSGAHDTLMERLARIHSKGGLDIRPHFYDIWLRCLIETLREFDPEFDDAVESAWRAILAPGIDFMKSRYDA